MNDLQEKLPVKSPDLSDRRPELSAESIRNRTMNFGDAQHYLNRGYKIGRVGSPIIAMMVKNATLQYIDNDQHQQGIALGDILVAKLPTGKFTPIMLDGADILANDWIIFGTPEAKL